MSADSPSAAPLVSASPHRTTTTELTTLHGFHWTLSVTSNPKNATLPALETHPATVPGTVLSTLAAHLPDPNLSDNCLDPVYAALEYATFAFDTSFTIPPELPEEAHLRLELQGLQMPANVFLNDQWLLSSCNSFHPYFAAIPSDILRRGSANNLRIHFDSVRSALQKRQISHSYREWNDPVGGISSVRVPQYLAGWDWGPRQLSAGIVRPVCIVHTPGAMICDIACQQQVTVEPKIEVHLRIVADVAVQDVTRNTIVRCLLLPEEVEADLGGTIEDEDDITAINRLLSSDLSVIDTLGEHGERVQLIEMKISPLGANDDPWNADGGTITEAMIEGIPPFRLWNSVESGDMCVCRYFGSATVFKPTLWWPNSMGEQPMYSLHVAVMIADSSGTAQGRDIYEPPHLQDSHTVKIGLRKVELIRESTYYPSDPYAEQNSSVASTKQGNSQKDATSSYSEPRDTTADHMESFIFAINGRRFFAKGANYIPLRMQYHETTLEEHEQTILSACEANMNMLRLWGGGVYENEAFYDACDRHGILLWHDFMFACSLYPGDEDFVESCRREVQYQVARLRNRACMAIWCGNNEIEQVPHDILKTKTTEAAYRNLFYDILPSVFEQDPGNIPYWPSSPHNPLGLENGFNNPNAGDRHFWGVWHAREPISSYLQQRTRFCSEFGMQSYISEAGARAFAGFEQGVLNPFGPIMESHQKNASGNLIMMEYCQRLYRAPRDYSTLSYQSQLNQLVCMKTGVEHFRRSWPFCAGALYWQLNDCWPSISWSSLEFGGNWKAIHFGARRFFSPLLVSAVHHGEESVGVCNLTSFSTKTGLFAIFATYDGPEENLSVKLSWSLVDVRTGAIGDSKKSAFILKRDKSCKLSSVDTRLRNEVPRNPRHHVLRVVLVSDCGHYESSTTAWFCSPRLCDLKTTTIRFELVRFESGERICKAAIRLESATFAPYVELSIKPVQSDASANDENVRAVYIAPTRYSLSNNYFDLFPHESVLVELTVHEEMSRNALSSRLNCRSLVDSYMV